MDRKIDAEIQLRLVDLPSEVLLHIFRHLDRKSLGRVAQSCHYFNHLASRNEIWKKWMKQTTICSLEMPALVSSPPCYKEHCRLSEKWTLGRCKTKKVLNFDKNFLPWLSFDPQRSNLYVAVGDTIKNYPSECWTVQGTQGFSRKQRDTCTDVVVHQRLDVCRFSVSDDFIVTGGWHGKLSWASTRNLAFTTNQRAHSSDISDVAVFDDCIISGSRDQSVKIWRLSTNEIKESSSELIHDTVLSIAVNKHKRTFAVGTGGIGGVHPLQIKDLNSGTHLYSLGQTYKNGAGVLDCHFQSPDLLMSTGYDTYVRLWDTRASIKSCVRSWEEPHDNTVYCVASDNRYGFVSGSCRHGVVRLWDTRLRNCLQTFYLGGKVSSPVYSVQFTQTHLFAGLARGIFGLDFR